MTTSIHRCTECNHPDYEHNEERVPQMANCCYGFCRCSQLRPQVRASGVAATIPMFPGFDHATGKWAAR